MNSTDQRLSILIKSLEMNSNAFADLVGINKSILSRILSDKQEPSVETLRRITKATKTSPEWILGYGEDTPIRKLDI